MFINKRRRLSELRTCFLRALSLYRVRDCVLSRGDRLYRWCWWWWFSCLRRLDMIPEIAWDADNFSHPTASCAYSFMPSPQHAEVRPRSWFFGFFVCLPPMAFGHIWRGNFMCTAAPAGFSGRPIRVSVCVCVRKADLEPPSGVCLCA